MSAAIPSLRVNFGWTLAANLVYAATQFVSLIVLAKLGSEAMVGRYALGLAITAPVFFFVDLKLRQVQATDARDEYRFADYLGMRCLSIPLGLSLILVVTLVAAYDATLAAIVLLVGATKAVESVDELAYGLMQKHERMDWIARSKLLRGVGMVAVIVVAIAILGSLPAALVGVVVVWTLVTFGDLRACARLLASQEGSRETGEPRPGAVLVRPQLDARRLRRLTRLALPLGLVTVIGSLEMNLPRYFVEASLGEESLGIYAAIAYLLTAGNTIIAALAHAAIPRLSRYFADGELRAFLVLAAKMVALGLAFGALGILCSWWFGELLLTLLFSPAYAQQVDVLVELMIAGAVTYVFAYLGTAANAMRRFQVQTPIHLASLIATTIGCSLWIPTRGLAGAADATLLGAVITLAAYLGWAVVALRRPPFRPSPRPEA